MDFVPILIKIHVFWRYRIFHYMQTPTTYIYTSIIRIYITQIHTYTYTCTHTYTCSCIRPGYDTLVQVCLILLSKISQHMPCGILNIAKSPYAVTKLKPVLCPYWYSNCIKMPEGQSICLVDYVLDCRSQWQRGLRRRPAAARLLRLWVRIQPGAWISVCCECSVLSGKGLCDEVSTCPEESYWL
jgi:hypothetical protein